MSEINIGVSGEYEFLVNGKSIAKFKNLITDGGMGKAVSLNGFGINDGQNATYFSYGHCFLGDGTATPVGSNTTLNNSIGEWKLSNANAGKGVLSNYEVGNISIVEMMHSFTYGAGTFSDTNVSEVGVMMRQAATEPAIALDSHALIKDEQGNPVTINLSSTDTLTVVFKYRQEINSQNVSKQMTIDGASYKVTFKPFRTGNRFPMGIYINYTATNRPSEQYIQDFQTEGFIGGDMTGFIEDADYTAPASPTDTAIGTTTRSQNAGRTASSGNDGSSWWRDITVTTGVMVATIGIKAVLLGGKYWNRFGVYDTGQAVLEFDPVLPSGAYTFGVRVSLHRGYSSGGLVPLDAHTTPLATMLEAAPNGAYTTEGHAVGYGGGGLPPYTYAWTRVSGDTKLTCDSPSARKTTWNYNGTTENANEVWRCTVTDANGDTDTSDVTIDVTWS